MLLVILERSVFPGFLERYEHFFLSFFPRALRLQEVEVVGVAGVEVVLAPRGVVEVVLAPREVVEVVAPREMREKVMQPQAMSTPQVDKEP